MSTCIMFWGLSLISSKSTPGSLSAIFLSQFLDKFSHVFWGMQSLRDCLIASMPLKRAVKQIHLQNTSLQTLYSVRKDIKLNILICHHRQMKKLKAASAFVFHLLCFLLAGLNGSLMENLILYSLMVLHLYLQFQ